MSMLVARDLHASYGQVEVLQGIDFEVGAGEIVVILGANGAGKTTTLRAISGMTTRRGELSFEGTSIIKTKTDAIVRLGIAQVPQGRGTFTDLTVEENLRVGAFIRSGEDVGSDVKQWYEIFPRLGDRRDQKAGTLSGGEQQMLAIARALMSHPKLLLCDEPSLGLAPLVTQELFRVLQRLNAERDTAMLVVEQNAALALDIAHRAYVLETGRLVASGTSDELRGDDAVRRAYLGF